MDTTEALIERACQPTVLAKADLHALAAVARTRHAGTGAQVLSRQDPAVSLWLVQSGRIALGAYGPGREFQYRCSVEGGQWLDATSALAGGCYAEDAVAEGQAVILELPWQAVLQAGLQRSQVLVALSTLLASRVVALTRNVRDLTTKDVVARCADWLLEHATLPAGPQAHTGAVHLHQRKRQIASQLGTTAETLSRTLRELSRRGWIDVRGYAIQLLDVQALRRLAAGAATPLPQGSARRTARSSMDSTDTAA